jgi:hypothetical protein
VLIRQLLFADDLAALCDAPALVQRTLDLVAAWCTAWGMKVGIGQGKTEAMAFEPAPLTPSSGSGGGGGDAHGGAAQRLPPLSCAGAPVLWSGVYRYLGCMVRDDLLDGEMTAKLLQRLRFGFHRFFTRNRLVRALPVATQLQVYRSTTVVAIEYLRCLLCLSARDNTALDAETRRAARAITGHPTGTSNVLVAAVTGLLPAEAACLRERERLWQHFHLTPFRNDVAVRLFEALQREPRSRASTTGRLANWAHVVERYRQRAREAGVVFDPPACYCDIRGPPPWRRGRGRS